MTPLRRNRDFRRLWVSQTLSEIGSQVTLLAVPLLVLDLTDSAIRAGAVGSAAAIARLLLRLPAGVLIDRFDRRRLMLACEAARAAAMGLLGLAVLTGTAPMWLITLVAVVEAAGYVVFSAAERVILRHLVEPSQLAAASATNETRAYTASLLGPSAGGVLFGLSRAVPFLADAATYTISLAVVALIRRPLRSPAPTSDGLDRPDWRRSLAEAWRFVRMQPFLRAASLFVPVLNLAYVGTLFVTILALQRAGIPPGLIGLVQAMVAVGGLAGAAIAPWLIRTTSPRLIIVVLCGTMTAAVTGCALLAPSLWMVAPLPLLTTLIPPVNAVIFAHQTMTTPDRLYGRVISLQVFLSTLIAPIAPIAGGLLVEHASATAAFGGFAACLALAAVIAFGSRGLRGLRAIAPSEARP